MHRIQDQNSDCYIYRANVYAVKTMIVLVAMIVDKNIRYDIGTANLAYYSYSFLMTNWIM